MAFEFNNPLLYELREGSALDPYASKVDTSVITNNKIILSELPDQFSGITIPNYSESKSPSDLISTSFYCNYLNGTLSFSSTENGKTVTATYLGRGIIAIPAERIYTKSVDGSSTETFQQVADNVGNASTVLSNLSSSISTGNVTNSNLISSISTANSTKTDLNNMNIIAIETEASLSSANVVASEATRIQNESQRLLNEGIRVNSEVTRVSAENIRKSAEEIRIPAEVNRNNAESARLIAENLRIAQNNNSISAENIRIASENERIDEEVVRQDNENTRLSQESSRIIAESSRVGVENTRVSQELSRVGVENTRVTSENIRLASEISRVGVESARVSAENIRESNEETRISQENTREINEDSRISDESNREANELIRISQEDIRESQETNRQSTYSSGYINFKGVITGITSLPISDNILGDTYQVIDDPTTANNAMWRYNGTIFEKSYVLDLTFAGGYGANDSQVFTSTENQTVFTLTEFPYLIGVNQLMVYVTGIKQIIGVNYTETSTNSFTLTSGVVAGTKIEAFRSVPGGAGSLTTQEVENARVSSLGIGYANLKARIDAHDFEKVGNLSGLPTVAKTDIVSSIIEVSNEIAVLNGVGEIVEKANNTIIDAGNIITATTVEGALQEIETKRLSDKADNAKQLGYVTYEMFNVYCDGINDDGIAIKEAHIFANANNYPVKCLKGKSYYILGTTNIPVKTDTDWGNSKFIIDDKLGTYNEPVFVVLPTSGQQSLSSEIVNSVASKIKIATNRIVELAGYGRCLVRVTNSSKIQFIRKGLNADSGHAQLDQFIVDNDGYVENEIIWDFDTVTGVILYPIDEQRLIVSGGHFTSLTNVYSPEYLYMGKNIHITRSNVLIRDLTHTVADNNTGRPYNGFITTQGVCLIHLKDCNLDPRPFTQNVDGVSMGTYDMVFNETVDITLENVNALSKNPNKWGVIASNYLKDCKIFNCKLSRIDAHLGVWNLTIKDSVIGEQGLSLIGGGLLLIENITIYSLNLVFFRDDYGSNWNGNIAIKNVKHIPFSAALTYFSLLYFANDGTHDFGYDCRLGLDFIKLENYTLDSSNLPLVNQYYLLNIQAGSLSVTTIPPYAYKAPKRISFKNIKVRNPNVGFIVITNNVYQWFSDVVFAYEVINTISIANKLIRIQENITIDIEDVQLKPISTDTMYNASSNLIEKSAILGFVETDAYLSEPKRLIARFNIRDCKNIVAGVWGLPCILNITDSEIVRLVGQTTETTVPSGTRSNAYINNCTIRPVLSSTKSMVRINPSGYRFSNCTFYSPILSGVALTTQKADLILIYEFLNSLIPLSDGKYIQQLGIFSNCAIDSSIDLTIFATDIAKVYRFKFGNNNNDLLPATVGPTLLKPTIIQSNLPIGFEFYDTTLGAFSKWNGIVWS